MINLLENLSTRIVEMRKIAHVIWIGIGLVIVFLIVTYRGQIDTFFNSSSASNYLLIAIIVVEGLGNFFAYYMGKRDRVDDEKERHTHQLIENIFSKMADLHMVTEVDHKIYFSIPKPQEVIEEEEQYDYNVSEYWEITDLKRPYLDYALKHLEKYENIESSFKKLFELSKQHNDSLDNIKEEVKSKIKTIFETYFPHVREYNNNDKTGYNLQEITNALSDYLYVDSLDLPSENGEVHKGIRVSLEEVKQGEFFRIARIGYGETLITCKKQGEIDIKRLNDLLTQVCNDENIKKRFKEIISIYVECEKAFNFFGTEMGLFIERLRSGIKLKGKCELGL